MEKSQVLPSTIRTSIWIVGKYMHFILGIVNYFKHVQIFLLEIKMLVKKENRTLTAAFGRCFCSTSHHECLNFFILV